MAGGVIGPGAVRPYWRPRHGQWVKWNGAMDGVHAAQDGYLVGLYQRAYVDGTGGHVPERVVPVSPSGENVPGFVDGRPTNAVYLDPARCFDLQPVVKRDDLPEARVKHLPPTWNPKA